LAALELAKEEAMAAAAAAGAEKEKLLPQLEEARWQARQLEKKLAEVKGSQDAVAKVITHTVDKCPH
jgi:hypothetical protein